MNKHQLPLAILESLSQRGSTHGYALLEIAGSSADDVEAMVKELWRAGLVEAWNVPHGFGPEPDRVTPSVLTDRGRQHLLSLRMKDGAW
jgi:DNA-binding MarR family transcriptional regulator